MTSAAGGPGNVGCGDSAANFVEILGGPAAGIIMGDCGDRPSAPTTILRR